MSGIGQGNGISRIVGANIRRARKEAGLYQRQLGNKIDVSVQQISDWERGAAKPRDASLARLADALDRPYYWFYMDHAREEQAA